ncbi:MAG: alkaline phosphatase family protein [Candidatus Aureabacteria bacterium]|nr:alkaline phosphatase family protein [Candidatus Auribacterota bacterium]
MSKKRIIFIGLDGVPFGLLKDLAQKGVMPNTKKVIEQGCFRKMFSSVPEISSVAWSSIITGKNPAEHGIFGFTDLIPNSYSMRFPNFSNLKAEPFWNLIEGPSVILNVPSTYPVKPMNGVHISGFVSIDFKRSVYPLELIPVLQEKDYRLDVNSEYAHKSFDLFLSDLNKTLEARMDAAMYLWNKYAWQVFMLVFTGTDRLMHFLWNAYEDEKHTYHDSFIGHFRKVDEAIGEISQKMRDEDTLIMLSDHGFERLDKDVYINHILKENGFLSFQDNTAHLKNISGDTKAFALDPARIYINQKEKYPRGRVSVNDREKIITDLIDLFQSLTLDNKKLIRKIFRKEDVYHGQFLDVAPDLILLGEEGFNLKGNIKAQRVADRSIFSGKHTLDTAFLAVSGSFEKGVVPEAPCVYDIWGLIREGLEDKKAKK